MIDHANFSVADYPRSRAFYAAALAPLGFALKSESAEEGGVAGGRGNGPPGLRPHCHSNYCAAFVFDPDGHNIEAVCHAPGKPAARKNF